MKIIASSRRLARKDVSQVYTGVNDVALGAER